jgi:hypothetical protein
LKPLTALGVAHTWQEVLDVAGILGDFPRPRAETAVFINGFHPFVEETSLHLVLLRVLTFDLKDQVLTARETNQKIRPVLDFALPV